ncbi:hypothetical protein BAAA27673_03045 [Bifidobacterium animalis subsp. lactis ATCC 27673]|nr:hypothetical protein BAAA27673_03045 [Bifidobacterium animalis subsp. lactis ATCC 27673]
MLLGEPLSDKAINIFEHLFYRLCRVDANVGIPQPGGLVSLYIHADVRLLLGHAPRLDKPADTQILRCHDARYGVEHEWNRVHDLAE